MTLTPYQQQTLAFLLETVNRDDGDASYGDLWDAAVAVLQALQYGPIVDDEG